MLAKEFCEKHKVSLTFSSAPLRKDDAKNSFRYVVTVNYAGKAHTFDYWKGSAHVGYQTSPAWISGENKKPGEWVMLSYQELKLYQRNCRDNARLRMAKPIPPLVNEVLYCLAMDAQCIRDYPIWEDFADAMGYNSDSIKDKKIHKGCTENYLKLRELFGQQILNELMSVEDE